MMAHVTSTKLVRVLKCFTGFRPVYRVVLFAELELGAYDAGNPSIAELVRHGYLSVSSTGAMRATKKGKAEARFWQFQEWNGEVRYMPEGNGFV